MIPKMPSFPTGNAPVRSISPDWLRRLWRCVEYAMYHPTGDNRTTVLHGEYLSAKGGNGAAVGGSAAAPAQTEYSGPFAVSYDQEHDAIVVAPGWVDVCGALRNTPEWTGSAPNAGMAIVLYVGVSWDSVRSALSCSFFSTVQGMGSTVEVENVALAQVQKQTDGAVVITQFQHGPIRISGRAW